MNPVSQETLMGSALHQHRELTGIGQHLVDCSVILRLFSPADLFAIVKTTEKLERAYVRDAISAKDYEPLCEKLIAQFRTLWETLRDTVSPSALLSLHPYLTLMQMRGVCM